MAIPLLRGDAVLVALAALSIAGIVHLMVGIAGKRALMLADAAAEPGVAHRTDNAKDADITWRTMVFEKAVHGAPYDVLVVLRGISQEKQKPDTTVHWNPSTHCLLEVFQRRATLQRSLCMEVFDIDFFYYDGCRRPGRRLLLPLTQAEICRLVTSLEEEEKGADGVLHVM